MNLKIKFMLKYLSSFNYINGLFRNKDSNWWSSPCTCSYFYSQFYKKVSLELKLKRQNTSVKEEPVKIIELENTVIKEGKAETIKELSNKLDDIGQKADEVYEKVRKRKKKRRKKERITKLRSYQASIYLELGLYLFYLHLRDLCKIQFQLEFFSYKLL